MSLGPGFVDHHVHLLRVASGDLGPCDIADPAAVEAYHRQVAARWETPLDHPAPPPDQPDLGAALAAGLQQAARLGLVEVTEAGVTDWTYVDALRRLRDDGELPLRVRLLIASGIADVDRMVRLDDPSLDIVGVKFYADGWLGPRTCALAQPFADRPGDTGLLFLDADTLAKRADPFAEREWTIATHAIGDRAMAEVLTAYERIYGSDCAAAAPRIEHAQVLDEDLIARMASLGVVACIQPSFAVSDAETAHAALGADRAELAYRWDLLLEAGVRVIAGSDYAIETLSPLEGLQKLVTGAPLGRPDDPVAVALGLDAALAIMTDVAAGHTELEEDLHDVEPRELAEVGVVDVHPSR